MNEFFNKKKKYIFSVLVHVIVFSYLLKRSGASLIHTKYGPVKGKIVNVGLIPIYIFKNIPYAKPPIGNLRFEIPKETDLWLSPDDLRNDEVSCLQLSPTHFDHHTNITIHGTEDCLLLDVYIRKVTKRETLLPVLVYFHGGRFSTGSKEEYHPEFLISLHDIIVIIPNYRLGILGFLSSGDSKIPGNFGLWDQRQSLKWVYENIEYFGGDKNRVTIAGHDAGGVSVGFHVLSPQSHRFFSAALSGSGTVLDPWVFSHSTLSTMSHVAEKVGCSRNSSDNITNCLKHCDINSILEAQKELKKVQFLPTIDGYSKHSFLPKIPLQMYQMGYQKNVTYLAGITKNEASVEVSREFPKAVKHKHLDHIIEYLLAPYLKETPDWHIIAKAAKYHYLRGAVIPSFDAVQPDMEMLMTDFLYNSPLHSTLNLHSIRTPNTFMYVFNFKDEDSSLGVSHMIDAFYIFNKTFGEWTPRQKFKTNHIRKILCDVWGNYIKSQIPGNESVWTKFRSPHHVNYVEISETLSHKTNYRKNAMEFWNFLIPDLKYYHNRSNENYEEIASIKESNYTGWGFAGFSVVFFVLCVAMVGVVTVTRRRYPHSSIIPISSTKEDVNYSNIG